MPTTESSFVLLFRLSSALEHKQTTQVDFCVSFLKNTGKSNVYCVRNTWPHSPFYRVTPASTKWRHQSTVSPPSIEGVVSCCAPWHTSWREMPEQPGCQNKTSQPGTFQASKHNNTQPIALGVCRSKILSLSSATSKCGRAALSQKEQQTQRLEMWLST